MYVVNVRSTNCSKVSLENVCLKMKIKEALNFIGFYLLSSSNYIKTQENLLISLCPESGLVRIFWNWRLKIFEELFSGFNVENVLVNKIDFGLLLQ